MDKRPEGMDEPTGRFADGLLLPIFAVAAVFLFIILCFYAYNNVMKNKGTNSQEVAVLEGDDSTYKVAPESPGGMEVEHTDKAVFNTVTGEAEKTGEGVAVQDQEETPVTEQQLEQQAEADSGSAIHMPEKEGESSTVTLDPSVSKDNDEGTKTMIGSEDDTPSDPTLMMLNTAKTKPADATSNHSASEVKVPDAAKVAGTPTMKAEVKKETDKTTGESKTVVNFKEMPVPKSMKKAPASMPGATAASGSYFVQVGSYGSQTEADASWSRISSKYSAEIGGMSSNISEAEVKGKTFYRLSFGPFSDRGAASTKCGILKAKGQDCIIQRY